MPGLFGLISLSPNEPFEEGYAKSALKQMASRLLFRPDYTVDYFVVKDAGVAIGRVSHTSLKKTPWPLADSEDGKIFIHGYLVGDSLLTGARESYECQEDAVVTGFLRCLSGSYSLIKLGADRRSVILAVDRTTSQPIYYRRLNGVVAFAPEVKAILPLLTGPVDLNMEAVPFLLSSGHLLSHQTLISSINKLPGGSYLQISANRATLGSYWSYKPGAHVGLASEPQLREELANLVRDSAQKTFDNPGKTLILLSGGVDSRGVLGAALAVVGEVGERLNTASWGVGDNIPGSDAAIAERLARQLGCRHTFFRRDISHYPENFEQTNYIVDGLTDIAAMHPYEFNIMRQIKALVFDRLIRSDQTFGLYGRVYSYSQAEVEVGIRPLAEIDLYSQLLRAKYFRLWCDGAAGAICALRSKTRGMHFNDAKDYMYLTQRLECYLNSAAVYSRLLLDHRNVLLDAPILEFLSRVPWRLRLYKHLWRSVVAASHPSFDQIPYASDAGRENWHALLARPSTVRSYVDRQLNDVNSGVWEYFDRAAVRNLFESLPTRATKSADHNIGMAFRALAKKSLALAVPQVSARIRAKRIQSIIHPHQALLRFLVFKNWHDMFVSGHRSQPSIADSITEAECLGVSNRSLS
jgi:asparagine synthetase B (glutamine-hydrolysing)